MSDRIFILGGGVTGLAAGYASGLPIFEASSVPGGICSSYYMRPSETQRLYRAPEDGEAYRFEVGGGHWIFGGDPAILRFIRRLTPVKDYHRRSAVYVRRDDQYVPYPLQYHLSYLKDDIATRALQEMLAPSDGAPVTMDEWLVERFGPTLTNYFFGPFHERYTAGLWKQVAPQDAYKSPVDPEMVIQGALGNAPSAGYNVTFLYPEGGLDALVRQLARDQRIHYGKRVTRVDTDERVLGFSDGTETNYDQLISTLPLNKMADMANLDLGEPPDPYTSVLVVNVGALRGAKCPDDHWIYVPDSEAGFFRVGFYSNVDASFLPRSARGSEDRVSVYVERAYRGGEKPEDQALQAYVRQVIDELQRWAYIEDVEVVDPTWIEVAYTWSRPGSSWREEALRQLEARDILMVGRYGRWVFQGIADSLRDGLFVGGTFAR